MITFQWPWLLLLLPLPLLVYWLWRPAQAREEAALRVPDLGPYAIADSARTSGNDRRRWWWLAVAA